MIRILLCAFATIALLLAPSVYANLEVTFIEGAPKDRFVIKNIGACALDDLTIDIDLASSKGRLIFDTTAEGEGVEVYQPFEITEGELALISDTDVKDGDDRLSLAVKKLGTNELVSFTIDVDDTLPRSELGKIRVTDSEIMGGSIQVQSETINKVNAFFDNESRAILKLTVCS